MAASRLAATAALALAGCADPADPPPLFVARAAGSGVGFAHDAGGCGRKYFVEINAGGVSLLDHDGDGDLDLWFAQGEPLPGRPAQAPLLDRLYRNDGGFRFTDVTRETGAGEDGYSFSAACPDVDGDGDVDLYVCNYGRNRLLVNDGRGRFTDATDASGLGGEAWSSCAAFADLDRDGDLDLYVGNYVVYDVANPRACGELERGEAFRAYCHPDVFPGTVDELYRNDGGTDGAIRFTRITDEAGVGAALGKALAVVPGDVDGDGDVDFYVANDHTPNFLWRNDTPAGGTIRLTEAGAALGVAQNGDGRNESCMGSDLCDVDLDGDLDVFSANMAMETNTLWTNHGRFFTDDTDFAGLARDSYLWVGFGAKFLDADLDGDPDLVVSNGHVLDNVELYDASQSFAQPAHLYWNDGSGKFRLAGAAAGPYFGERHVGRSLAAGDLDGDGDLDLVLAHWQEPPQILENTTIRAGRGPGWIGLRLRARGANSQAIGARVVCRAGGRVLLDEVRGAASYSAWNDTRLVFATGAARSAERIEIRWPDGATQVLEGLPAGRYHEIRQE